MEGFVYELGNMVNGSSMRGIVGDTKRDFTPVGGASIRKKSGKGLKTTVVSGQSAPAGYKRSNGNGAQIQGKKLTPEQVIPFEEKELDF